MSGVRTGLFVLILCTGMVCAATTSASERCLKMVTAYQGGDQLILPSLVNELARNGLCLEVSRAPGSRATVLLRQGQIDGELFRVREYQQEIGDLGVRVPIAIFEAYGLLVTRNTDHLSLEALKGKPVALMRGTLWQERVLPRQSTPVVIDDYDAAFKMLETGRVAGVLIDTLSLKQARHRPDGLETRRVTPKTAAYAYLHRRHEHLVPALARVIRDWKNGFHVKLDGS